MKDGRKDIVSNMSGSRSGLNIQEKAEPEMVLSAVAM